MPAQRWLPVPQSDAPLAVRNGDASEDALDVVRCHFKLIQKCKFP